LENCTASRTFRYCGEPVTPDYLAAKVRRYMEESGIDKPGSCHLFRHACATHMLDNGADIRFIQAMLGHAALSSTERYTRVAIGKLQQIHAATHPAKLRRGSSAKGAPEDQNREREVLLEALLNEANDMNPTPPATGRPVNPAAKPISESPSPILL
jgi:hypothetical protein